MVLGPISFITSGGLNLPAVILLEQACRLSPYEQMVVLGVGSSRLQGNGLILGTQHLDSFRLPKILFLKCFSLSGKGASELAARDTD